MTVNYTADVSNGTKFVSFARALIRWRGSLYKLIWQDLLCYCILFIAINYINNNFLSPSTQKILQNVKEYVSSNMGMFPISFGLNFFVDQVSKKWWIQYQTLPSPDTLGIFTNATIPGKDEKSRMIRRTIVRYAVLSLVLTLRDISVRVKKRFPTLKHVEEAGFLMEDETLRYNRLDSQVTANHWMPLAWAASIATHAKTLKKITSDQCLRLLITELTLHRDKLGTLVNYDLVNIPLVYTQTMVVLVTSYVIFILISAQPTTSFSSVVNFIIYVGLMKVATVMLNPFGEDDDDFELNAIIDRHLKAAYMIVDEMHEEEPEVVKDAYWDEVVPKELPYTVGSIGFKEDGPDCFREDKTYSDKPPRQRFSFFRKGKVLPTPNDIEAIPQTNGVRPRDLLNSDTCSIDSSNKYENLSDFEIYSIPDPGNLVVQPSTSRAYYSCPERY